MDLRGFSAKNKGCVFELGVLVRVVPLERIILLTDATTNMPALAETVDEAWRAAPAHSANVRMATPKIALIPLSGSTRINRKLLESWLFFECVQSNVMPARAGSESAAKPGLETHAAASCGPSAFATAWGNESVSVAAHRRSLVDRCLI
jgi:hypothetical protein